MKQCVQLLLLMSVLCACGQDPGSPSMSESEPQRAALPEGTALTGKQAYDRFCAGCHAEGLNGAPATGNRDAWEGRSWLWEAVLFEHAREGIADMPAKGGAAQLDEATVTRAAEYMLQQAYPEAPPD